VRCDENAVRRGRGGDGAWRGEGRGGACLWPKIRSIQWCRCSDTCSLSSACPPALQLEERRRLHRDARFTVERRPEERSGGGGKERSGGDGKETWRCCLTRSSASLAHSGSSTSDTACTRPRATPPRSLTRSLTLPPLSDSPTRGSPDVRRTTRRPSPTRRPSTPRCRQALGAARAGARGAGAQGRARLAVLAVAEVEPLHVPQERSCAPRFVRSLSACAAGRARGGADRRPHRTRG
jgi:hypothetical protein